MRKTWATQADEGSRPGPRSVVIAGRKGTVVLGTKGKQQTAKEDSDGAGAIRRKWHSQLKSTPWGRCYP